MRNIAYLFSRRDLRQINLNLLKDHHRGFDQNAGFEKGSPESAARLVRECHNACQGGGYICSPSDHFFKGDPRNFQAFVDETVRCVY